MNDGYIYYINDSSADSIIVDRAFDAPNTSFLTYTTNTVDWCNSPYELSAYKPSKHFNCKRCGAPNQIDVCEYCGCAAED